MSYDKHNKLHIVAVNAAIRNQAAQYLVLKRSDNETAYPGAWCFPGGKVEGNQTVDEALSEEVREETGLTLKPGKVLIMDTSFVRPDDQTVKVFVYLCSVEEGEIQLENSSFTDARWITPEQLTELNHVGLTEDIEAAERMIHSGVRLEDIAVASKLKE